MTGGNKGNAAFCNNFFIFRKRFALMVSHASTSLKMIALIAVLVAKELFGYG